MRLPTTLSLCCALLACAGGGEVELLSLASLSPQQIEPGAELRVQGEGLSVGRSCEVVLRGEVRRPGAAPRRVSATAAGRAISDDTVAFHLDAEAFRALGDHGSFECELSLAFTAHDGRGRISGRLPVSLDLVNPMGQGPAYRQGLRVRASEVLAFVGIVPTLGESSSDGLVIDWAAPGSAAERLGLAHGDVIVSAGGVRVHGLGDLAPAPASSRLELRVRTPPHREPRGVTLGLRGLDAPVIDVSEARLSVLLCFVVVCLLLLSPLPSPALWLHRMRGRLRAAPGPAMGLWGGTRRDATMRAGLLARAERIALRWLWPLSISLAAALVIVLEPAGVLRLRSLSIYLAFAAVSVGMALMSESGSARARMAAGWEVGSRMLVLMVLILCACALSGTRSFAGLVADQGGWPWQWAVFCKPALLLSLPLFLIYAARLGAATLALGDGHGQGRTARLLVAERVLTNVVLCAVGVAVYFGGWQAPAELYNEHVPLRVVGAALFVLKCWALAYMLQLSRRVQLGMTLGGLAIAGTVAGVVGLTALGLYLEPSHTLELAIGRALLGAIAITAAVTAAAPLLPRGPVQAVSRAR